MNDETVKSLVKSLKFENHKQIELKITFTNISSNNNETAKSFLKTLFEEAIDLI